MFVVTKNQAKAKANSLHKFLEEKGIDIPASETLNAVARMAGFNDWNSMSMGYKDEAVKALLEEHEQDHAWDSVECDLVAEEQGVDTWGPECCVQVASGFWMVTPALPADITYVRVCDPLGREIAYWNINEVTEDAEIVLGALVGALNRGRNDVKPDPLNPSADKIVICDRVSAQTKSKTEISNKVHLLSAALDKAAAEHTAGVRPEGFKLLFSYSAEEDYEAFAKGYTYLGTGLDQNGSEAKVFQMILIVS